MASATSASFSNGTIDATPANSTNPVSTTQSPASLTTPPPCCWIIAGTKAVGVDRWWSTAVEETVATVVTNYLRYADNSTRIANTTTIYAPANATFPLSMYGLYEANDVYQISLLSPLSLPTDILTGEGATLTNDGDYAGTSIVRGTVQTWDYTDLAVTSPTPYDEWFGIGILTMYPAIETTPTSTYEPTQCGYWVPEYSVSYRTIRTTTWTTPWGTYTEPLESTIATITTGSVLYPSGYSEADFEDGPDWGNGGPRGPTLDYSVQWGADTLSVTYILTYIQPLATQIPDSNAYMDLPPGLIPWLASNATIKSKYPYIEQCYKISGNGQPTVHVPVNQVTASSSNFITIPGPAPSATTTAQSSNAAPVVSSPIVQTSAPTLDTPTDAGSSPTATAQSQAQPTSDDNAPQPGTTQQATQQSEINQASQGSQANEAQPTTGNDGGSDTVGAAGQGTLTTSKDIGGLLGAISSVAQQQAQSPGGGQGAPIAQASSGNDQSQGTSEASPAQTGNAAQPPAVVQTNPATSVTGFVIGSQTIKPGGSAAVVSGTTYSAPAGGSGVQVANGDSTSTIQPAGGVIGGTGAFTTLEGGQSIGVVALPAATATSITVGGQLVTVQSVGSNEVVLGSQILSVGGPANTQDGQAVSLVAQSTGLGLAVGGTSTAALSYPSAASQVVTSGGQTFTAYAAASSAVVIDGQTAYPGTATLIAGETVSLKGSDLLVASGTATSTEGLGGAIISGLGGRSTATESMPVAYTGGVGRLRFVKLSLVATVALGLVLVI